MKFLTVTLICLITLVTSVVIPAELQGENDLSGPSQDVGPMLTAILAPVTMATALLPKSLALETKKRSDKTLDVAPIPTATRAHATMEFASLPNNRSLVILQGACYHGICITPGKWDIYTSGSVSTLKVAVISIGAMGIIWSGHTANEYHNV
ncbi:hypothetical protein BBP40_006614 [Aspergillus hancockii]|nr:hypothetical protein BBP40_006614 [Aspergillus hancockii]